jgi:hypothetical protein
VFPAAIADTIGPSVSMNGSFHAPMINVTPSGSRRTRTWPGSITIGVASRRGLIQSCRCASANSASWTLMSMSMRSASVSLRRRSCRGASRIAPRLASIIALIAFSCSTRHDTGLVFPALKYLRWPWTSLV